jgi:hypothetical protein
MKYLSVKKDQDYTPFTLEFTKYNIAKSISEKGFILGVYSDRKLIGTIGANLIPVMFQNTKLMSCTITLYGIDPDFLPLSRDSQLKIYQAVIEKIKETQTDFIWVVFDLGTSFGEHKVFRDDLHFIKKNPNAEPLTKLLGSYGIDILRKKRGLSVVLAQLAKMMAKMQKISLPGGNIREATPKDYPQIVELLNGYSKLLDITQIWTVESFKKYIEINSHINKIDNSELKAEYPDTTFGFFIKVWERENKIIAALTYRVMGVQFKKGKAPLSYWDYLALSQDLAMEDKKAFIVNMYNEVYRKASTLTAFFPYYETKALKKSGFMSSQMKTPMYIYPLTENGKKLLELKKISKFYLPYICFLV